jgi:large subunit ribosomal protein L1
MRKRSKRYRKGEETVDRSKRYTVRKALELLQNIPPAAFDETVEIAMKLGVDTKKPDQMLRGAFSLPHGAGKTQKVIAFAEGEFADKAAAAGAVEVGGEELVKKIQDGWLEFDVAVAHPSMMRFVGKLGRLLGPKGKMPSPKSGTVTADVGQAVQEFAAGKIEYRTDAAGNIHAPVGRRSFDIEKLQENVEAFISLVTSLKPPSVKGTYLQRIHLTLTMGTSVPVRV